jgi:predicted nucleic acid-binding protein
MSSTPISIAIWILTRRAVRVIAATAAAHGLILVTRNPDDFVGLDSVVKVIAPH